MFTWAGLHAHRLSFLHTGRSGVCEEEGDPMITLPVSSALVLMWHTCRPGRAGPLLGATKDARLLNAISYHDLALDRTRLKTCKVHSSVRARNLWATGKLPPRGDV